MDKELIEIENDFIENCGNHECKTCGAVSFMQKCPVCYLGPCSACLVANYKTIQKKKIKRKVNAASK